MTSRPPVLLACHSTRPRGGLVHTLFLAEALQALGQPVHLLALGEPDQGLFRPTPVPFTIVSAPTPAPTLEERVHDAAETLEKALLNWVARVALIHTQDCIAARAAVRVRDAGAPIPVVRTVHHVDDFTTQALIDCQRGAILDPDLVLVVSRYWQDRLRAEFGVDAPIVPNGVDTARFAPVSAGERRRLRASLGASPHTPVLLTVGGIEPRKGTATLFAAMSLLKRSMRPAPVLAIVGGHSFQDYQAYREAALARLPGLGLELGRDVVLLGTVPESELGAWYRAADAFAFPSVKEGFGLVVLEALAAGLPVVATDIDVFAEYLTHDLSALLVPPGDTTALAGALSALCTDPDRRARLVAGGAPVVERFTWAASARRHLEIYAGTSAPG